MLVFSASHRLLESADAFIFHSPYCKLVQKSVARLMFNDFVRSAGNNCAESYNGLETFRYGILLFSYDIM